MLVTQTVESVTLRTDAKMPLSEPGISVGESRIRDNVVMKFDDEYTRKMNEEDKHTIKNYESHAHLGEKAGVGILGAERKD